MTQDDHAILTKISSKAADRVRRAVQSLNDVLDAKTPPPAPKNADAAFRNGQGRERNAAD